MSGPKVVHVATREEILADCEAALRRLERARLRWQMQIEHLGALDNADLAATLARHERIRELLHDDRFRELHAAIPPEIAFLKRDLEQREENAVAKAASKRQSQRRLRENAAVLLQALHAESADATLIEAVKAISAGDTVNDTHTILARGFASLAEDRTAESLSDSQRELAQVLQTEQPTAWVTKDHGADGTGLDRMDHQIARLQTLYGAKVAEPFLHRLEAIQSDSRLDHRDMLLDSLLLDISQAASNCQARRAAVSRLEDLANELEALLPGVPSELGEQVAACLANPATELQQIVQLEQRCSDAIATERQQRAASDRRRVVLEGLTSLGYEVREGMQTAWADAGRIVLRKPATPGYGVEVGGNAIGGKLQVRPVSLSNSNDRGRDRDIETIWCGEFIRLRSILADSGTELTIEKALAVGEVPLKVVAMDEPTEEAASSLTKRMT